MRILFMGTPEFAVPCLTAIAEKHDIVGVFTQTDKPAGRGKKTTFSAVKVKALALDLCVYQPEKINEEHTLELIRSLKPDVIVVVAYGQILKQSLLDIPPKGCINVHGSLLPHLRGAAPVQFALLEGLLETGVTTMYMARGLDSGDIIAKRSVVIHPHFTAGDLHNALMVLGAELLLETLEAVETNTVKRVPQNGDQATYCTLISKEMARIDWNLPAVQIERMVRAYNPWPMAFTTLEGEAFKIVEATVSSDETYHEPGIVVSADAQGIVIQTGQGVLNVRTIQPPSSKRMSVQAYLSGHKLTTGTFFGG